jgi:hypothetical protein
MSTWPPWPRGGDTPPAVVRSRLGGLEWEEPARLYDKISRQTAPLFLPIGVEHEHSRPGGRPVAGRKRKAARALC